MTRDRVYLWRDRRGNARASVPHKIVRHSPTGFEWGYGGSGPADLALNILAYYYPEPIAYQLYQQFKRDFLCNMPREGGEIAFADIDAWVQDRFAEQDG